MNRGLRHFLSLAVLFAFAILAWGSVDPSTSSAPRTPSRPSTTQPSSRAAEREAAPAPSKAQRIGRAHLYMLRDGKVARTRTLSATSALSGSNGGVDVDTGADVALLEVQTTDSGKVYRVQTQTGQTGWISGEYLEMIDISDSAARGPIADVAPSASSAAPSGPGERVVHGDHWIGCTDRDYFDKLITYATQHDEQAYRTALFDGLRAGTCTSFVDGERVFIVDTAIFSGLVKVRRVGDTAEYWTNSEAVAKSR